MNNKTKLIDILMLTLALSVCVWWAANPEQMAANPYYLGLVRGFVYPTLIFTFLRRLP